MQAGYIDSYNFTIENGHICQQSKLVFMVHIRVEELARREINMARREISIQLFYEVIEHLWTSAKVRRCYFSSVVVNDNSDSSSESAVPGANVSTFNASYSL